MSKAVALVAAVLSFGIVTNVAHAQAPAPAPAPTPAGTKGKRDQCRESVYAQVLQGGIDRRDAMQICIAEGRLDCVKQAVGQKIPFANRKAFMATCLGAGKVRPEEDAPPIEQ